MKEESPAPLTAAGKEYNSEGERRVRIHFNVGGDSIVDAIKQKTAELINLSLSLKDKDPRAAAEAATCYETAGMYAVKAATA